MEKDVKFYLVESVEHAFYLIKYKKETIVQKKVQKGIQKFFNSDYFM